MSQASVGDELEALFKEPIASVYAREQTTFEGLTSPFERSLVLFGAGRLGRETLAGLRRIGIQPLAFADNSPALWGREIDGVQVFAIEDAARRFGKSAAFVITIWTGEAVDTMEERQRQLRGSGCERVSAFNFLFWKYPEVFLPHYAIDLPHKVYEQEQDVRKVFALWADEASQHEYLAQLRWRLSGDVDGLPRPVTHPIYFPNDLVAMSPDEVFVDCGAYDGDTVRTLLNGQAPSPDKIIAFEPDPENFQRLQHYALSLPREVQEKLTLDQSVVGASKSIVRFEASGTEASAVGSGDLEVNCVTLDESLVGQKPSYIKMDIEGSELDALAGSERTIRENLPVLAICSYHRQDHLWRIPSRIQSFTDQYRFFLRPHLHGGWDLVCYAIPAHRLLANG